MNEMYLRQSEILLRFIEDYKSKKINLNSLIQKIEGIRNVVEISDWRDAVFTIILTLEQINALVIEEGRSLAKDEDEIVNKCLVKLDELVQHLRCPVRPSKRERS